MIPRFGGPEVLEVQTAPDAHAGPDQVLIKVEAGGLNFADLMTTRGGYPGTPKPPLIAGREFAGVDPNGRRVMGYAQWAAFAEQTVAYRSMLWPAPADWSAEQGAAFPVNFFTAYLAFWKAGLIEKPSRDARADSCRGRRSWDGGGADRENSRHRNVRDLFFGR